MRLPFVSRDDLEQTQRGFLAADERAAKLSAEATEAEKEIRQWKAKYNDRCVDWEQERARYDDQLESLRHELAASRAMVPAEPLTDEDKQRLLASKCVSCGGSHSIACPRVKRMRFRADGQTPVEVEFFPDDQWPKSRVVFLEDLP